MRQYRLFVDDAPSGRPWDEVSCLLDGHIEANTLVLQWSASGEIRVGGIVDVTRSDSSWGPALRLEGTVLWVGSETDALPARVVWLA